MENLEALNTVVTLARRHIIFDTTYSAEDRKRFLESIDRVDGIRSRHGETLNVLPLDEEESLRQLTSSAALLPANGERSIALRAETEQS